MTPQPAALSRFRWPLLPLAALIATLPLILHGYSCGHDFDFHLQSWIEAAAQFRHGTLLPHWAYTVAWNAGEPRFVFYPPLSWMLGGVLTLLLPVNAVPAAFTLLALTGAAFAMDRLAREFVPPNAALIAATLYVVNPYTLFTAYERTAYGELLAAAWMPLVFLAALRTKPTLANIAVPIGLLWLTNDPAAVMGCYTFALLIVLRLIFNRRRQTEAAKPLLLVSAGGTALGLALAGFSLLPAAYERRYVQIAQAIIPNMRYQDGFLFGRTSDEPHNVVLRTVSIIAVIMLCVTAATLGAAWKSRRNPEDAGERNVLISTAAITLLIAFLLVPVSSFVWAYLPEFKFLQFPWRLLSVLAVALGMATALLAERLRPNRIVAIGLLLVVAGVLSQVSIGRFRQGCELLDRPSEHQALFFEHHGFMPTDEYTPGDADNDVIRTNEPAWWLAAKPTDFGPGSIPNPAATIVNYDEAPPLEQTFSATPPAHFEVTALTAGYLVLNLRDYPAWEIADTGESSMSLEHPEHFKRDDGLIAVPIAPGHHSIDIRWRRTWDQVLGIALSLFAALALSLSVFRSRTLKS